MEEVRTSLKIPKDTYDQFSKIIGKKSLQSELMRLIEEEIDWQSRKQESEDGYDVVRVVNGKRYDTNTAKMIGEKLLNTFNYLTIVLYKKNNGELFFYVYCRGGDFQHEYPDIVPQKHQLFNELLEKMPLNDEIGKLFPE